MENQKVVCILCDKETSVTQSIEDCETGKPICYGCNEKEFALSQAAQPLPA
jgi:hypothetical protein